MLVGVFKCFFIVGNYNIHRLLVKPLELVMFLFESNTNTVTHYCLVFTYLVLELSFVVGFIR
jgi:hypothetical protein